MGGVEEHPFGDFVLPGAKYLILGSFVARAEDGYDWYYGSRRNQFWRILRVVYARGLESKEEKQALFRRLGIAMTDVISRCVRKREDNADTSLTEVVYNWGGVRRILGREKIGKIFFTSRFVEGVFRRVFRDIYRQYPGLEWVTLPSPSPRFARMSLEEKINRYRELLPRLRYHGRHGGETVE